MSTDKDQNGDKLETGKDPEDLTDEELAGVEGAIGQREKSIATSTYLETSEDSTVTIVTNWVDVDPVVSGPDDPTRKLPKGSPMPKTPKLPDGS
ncbi:MAG: hypothetical protein AAFR17_18300 [Pseudomonadota bacterium]